MREILAFIKQKHIFPMAIIIIAILLLLGIAAGYILKGDNTAPPHVEHSAAELKTMWTCSMHPSIRQPEKGKCPICGMDLIPVKTDDDELGAHMMSMSEEAKKLADIQTEVVQRKFVDLEIPMVGIIDYDETRVKTIAAWVPGRLDRLYVDYTGVAVKKGDHLVEMYSPTLYSAQEELIQAIKSVKSLERSSSKYIKESSIKTVAAAREKLRLFGLKREQIEAIEKSGKPSATIQINSPTSGIVIHKNVEQGKYVKTGDAIYTVVDLSKVWVQLDAYESDLAWLRYGQEVAVKTEAFGDEVFRGWVSFIDPILNRKTRTIKVRVVVDNSKGKLRPNMFAKAIVKARIAEDEKIVSISLIDKWISPMHPEIIKDGPGACDVCGMDLVEAEQIGYTSTEEAIAPIVVPASAVLTTGKRAIVYVKVPGQKRPTFEGVEVELGPRAGDNYIIKSGLKEGQVVVTRGNFKIDSALQLLAKPSMMNPEGDGNVPSAHAHGDTKNPTRKLPNIKAPTEIKRELAPSLFLEQLQPQYSYYFTAQAALAADNFAKAKSSLSAMTEALTKPDMTLLTPKAHMTWMKMLSDLKKSLEQGNEVKDIAELRKAFLEISNNLINIEKGFGHSSKEVHRLTFCPMANNDKGGFWLQLDDAVKNPYYGASMLSCGEIRKVYPGNVPLTDAERTKVELLYTHYLNIQKALAADSDKEAATAAQKIVKLITDKDLPKIIDLKIIAKKISESTSLIIQRQDFNHLTVVMEKLINQAGTLKNHTVLKAFCPMAFNNKGAYWLQEGKEIRNPYFGKSMLTCGEITGTISAPKDPLVKDAK